MIDLPLAPNRLVFFMFAALLASMLTARALSHFAARVGLMDEPGGRKQHEGRIPITGGVGMYTGFAAAMLGSGLVAGPTLALVVALGLLTLGGVLDDMHDITPAAKFWIQLVAALFMTSWAGVFVYQLGNLFGFGPINLYNWAIPFSVVCALGVINAINMLDGLDGAAGGTALVASLWLACAALLQSLGTQAVLLLILAAAVAGFLAWNIRVPPLRSQARVFMGDAGSMMLGLALCWFSIDVTQGSGRTMPPIVCMWILAVPLLDMVRVMFFRLRRGRSMLGADREHFHHLLLAAGVPHHAAAAVVVFASVLCGGAGIAAWQLGVPDWAMSCAFIAAFLATLASAYRRERDVRSQDVADG